VPSLLPSGLLALQEKVSLLPLLLLLLLHLQCLQRALQHQQLSARLVAAVP
jgi:hypothetical protein